ncbi:MAG TPA: DUF4870 domain-containing protein [Petrimonas sp.]|uniref:DUF4870 domain-containing protein n=1 Tax=Petrimonas sp. TaxID=2023866 RepID=UPI000964AAFF|nr:DUF4870 domain-containing protein [Petrimonas sp.]OJV39102.1 MAG: hypothetical protein BGO33_14175 [Bacteroidia bacterium 43-41]MEA4978741.1 DUF4870 domain-containing protein [Petrimonas sp.]MEA5045064.1 DUF4870 domain-containing protein [Petrimonas sp.]MEA5062484.1 DUF4870 domain-containing protein [Petrimonas sp.]
MKYEDLKILDDLREKGSITEEEYQREKAKILNDTASSSTSSGSKPLFGLEENTYLMLMHLSQLLGLLLPLAGFVAPVIMWITNKETNANVDLHGKNILNFIISYLIYSAVLAITIIGIPLLIVLGIIYLVFVILASVKANNGEYWRYPFIIQFLK